jgi:hypothetical protein
MSVKSVNFAPKNVGKVGNTNKILVGNFKMKVDKIKFHKIWQNRVGKFYGNNTGRAQPTLYAAKRSADHVEGGAWQQMLVNATEDVLRPMLHLCRLGA